MRLVSFQVNGQNRIGALVEGGILDLLQANQLMVERTGQQVGALASDQDPLSFQDMVAFLGDSEFSLASASQAIAFFRKLMHEDPINASREALYKQKSVRPLPPLLRPGKIICVGMNYPDPAGENAPPQYPVLFLKASSSIIAAGEAILLPEISEEVNYEGELALVIAQEAQNIPRERAMDIVAGYTIANDVGAGDLERRTSQWTSGKIFDTFLPLGPALVTKEEIERPDRLRIRTTLNGQIVQDGNTGEMIFNLPYLLSYISSLTILEPGDLILTGSPKGMGREPAPRIPLSPGDEVQIEIQKLGRLTNPVQAADQDNEP